MKSNVVGVAASVRGGARLGGRHLPSLPFAVAMNNLKTGTSQMAVQVINQCAADLRPGRLPQRLALQPRPALARRPFGRLDGQQRPHPGQHRQPPDGAARRLRPARMTVADLHRAYRDELLTAGLLISMGVDGLYGRSGLFERVVEGINAAVGEVGDPDRPEVMRFPPGIGKWQLEQSGYLKSSPQLVGTVHSFAGNDADHRAMLDTLAKGGDWTAGQRTTQVALAPAACYGVYPAIGARGRMGRRGRAGRLLHLLLPPRAVDRSGAHADVPPARACAAGQRGAGAGLPREVDGARPGDHHLVRPAVRSRRRQRSVLRPHRPAARRQPARGEPEVRTAGADPRQGASDRLRQLQLSPRPVRPRLEDRDGDRATTAHTACVGFGVERITLALFKHHGFAVERWPASVRDVLGL